ncbi:MAG: hypothetical protein ACRERV_02390 [Methylococcales bacterium]
MPFGQLPPDRNILHDIIARRFRQMLEQGFIYEVEVPYKRGDLSEKMTAIGVVGYRRVWSYRQGETDSETMTEKAIIAKRQPDKRNYCKK